MSPENQRKIIRLYREKLLEELDGLYQISFDQLSKLDLGEGAITKLTRAILQSREAALSPLRKEIEAPVITTPPKNL